MALGFDVEI